MLDDVWPLLLLGMRVGIAAALYLFLFVAIRALRAEVRARTMPIATPLMAPARPATAAAAPGPVADVPRRHAPATPRHPDRDTLEVVAYETEGGTSEAADVTGRAFTLRGPALIGRAPGSSIVLPGRHVSARHARLLPRDGRWWVEDLGSTNGTFVGGRRVSGRVPLDPGAEVRFGPVVARLVPSPGGARG